MGGLCALLLGVYFYYLRVESFIALFVTTAGFVFLVSGIRYKERLKRAERANIAAEQRTKYLRSNRFILGMTGIVIMFSGLGAGLITLYYFKSDIATLWCLGVAIVGMLFMFAGKFFKDYSRETKKV